MQAITSLADTKSLLSGNRGVLRKKHGKSTTLISHALVSMVLDHGVMPSLCLPDHPMHNKRICERKERPLVKQQAFCFPNDMLSSL